MSKPELEKFYETLGGDGGLPLEPSDPYYVPIFERIPVDFRIVLDALRCILAEHQG